MSEFPIILGIESSCDDTSAAIIQNSKILSNIVANQKIHQNYGGVVPELASRAHQQNIVPVVDQAIQQADLKAHELSAIAFTRGPGLLGSLLVGNSFAKSLSMTLEIPLIEVNHMHAHIMAHFIDDANKFPPKFPFLCLTVSGGHTQIVKVSSYFEMEVLGETLDDAAGEAFDKSGKILGLDYPSGPLIDRFAKSGNPNRFNFPEPKVDGLNFSFSGLKTSILYFIQKETKSNPNFVQDNLEDLCASIQKKIVDILLNKLIQAAEQNQIQHLAIAGGVSANSELRYRLKAIEKEKNWKVYIPKFEYTTDNAAMIAMVGQLKYNENKFTNIDSKSISKYSI